jgi:hypothetical protein
MQLQNREMEVEMETNVELKKLMRQRMLNNIA